MITTIGHHLPSFPIRRVRVTEPPRDCLSHSATHLSPSSRIIRSTTESLPARILRSRRTSVSWSKRFATKRVRLLPDCMTRPKVWCTPCDVDNLCEILRVGSTSLVWMWNWARDEWQSSTLRTQTAINPKAPKRRVISTVSVFRRNVLGRSGCLDEYGRGMVNANGRNDKISKIF